MKITSLVFIVLAFMFCGCGATGSGQQGVPTGSPFGLPVGSLSGAQQDNVGAPKVGKPGSLPSGSTESGSIAGVEKPATGKVGGLPVGSLGGNTQALGVPSTGGAGSVPAGPVGVNGQCVGGPVTGPVGGIPTSGVGGQSSDWERMPRPFNWPQCWSWPPNPKTPYVRGTAPGKDGCPPYPGWVKSEAEAIAEVIDKAVAEVQTKCTGCFSAARARQIAELGGDPDQGCYQPGQTSFDGDKFKCVSVGGKPKWVPR